MQIKHKMTIKNDNKKWRKLIALKRNETNKKNETKSLSKSYQCTLLSFSQSYWECSWSDQMILLVKLKVDSHVCVCYCYRCLDFMVESGEFRNQDGFRWFIRALAVLKLEAKWTSFLFLNTLGWMGTIHRWIIVGQRPLKCSRWNWGWIQRDKQFCFERKNKNELKTSLA